MKTVEILLRENLGRLGRCGDVVRVAAGYARNYLLPRRLATEANEENKRIMLRRRVRLDAEEAARSAEIEAKVKVLSRAQISTVQKADESGRLYGSVNAALIAELLCELGHQVAERDVRLEAPIKSTGAHAVRVHVHGEYFAEVQLQVTAEE